MLPNYYSSGLVYADYYENCTEPQTFYFPVDSFTQTLQITMYGIQTNATVIMPNGLLINIFIKFI